MHDPFRRWAAGLLAAVCALLALCAAAVYAADPCYYFRPPENGRGVFFNERYQNAGLARNTPADTVVLGTSMAANFRPSHVAAIFGGTAVKLTVPDGYLSEFSTVLQPVWRAKTPKRVLFGLDANILIRDESGLTGALPAYLYDETPLNDAKYLLNKDALFYSVYALREARGGGTDVDDAFSWDATTWWNHQTALANYDRPELADTAAPTDAYLANARANARVVLGWAAAHPDTEFDVFFPPYSMLYWDKVTRLGQRDAVLAAVDAAVGLLLTGDNVRVFFPMGDAELAANLDNYCDYIHCSGDAADAVAKKIRAGDGEIKNAAQWTQTLSSWREFVINYPYDQYWDVSYWYRWDWEHPQT